MKMLVLLCNILIKIDRIFWQIISYQLYFLEGDEKKLRLFFARP